MTIWADIRTLADIRTRTPDRTVMDEAHKAIESFRIEFFDEYGGNLSESENDDQGRPTRFGGFSVALSAARLAWDIGDPVPEWALGAVDKYRPFGRDRVNRLEAAFQETGNPRCAVEAYTETRFIGDPLPEWILRYLDEGMVAFSGKFQSFIAGKRTNRPDQAFAEAFRIKAPNKRSGRGTIWTQDIYDPRPDEIGSAVVSAAKRRAESATPFNETRLIGDAEDEYKRRRSDPRRFQGPAMSTGTAWSSWRSYKQRHPDAAAEVRRLIASSRLKKSPTS